MREVTVSDIREDIDRIMERRIKRFHNDGNKLAAAGHPRLAAQARVMAMAMRILQNDLKNAGTELRLLADTEGQP